MISTVHYVMAQMELARWALYCKRVNYCAGPLTRTGPLSRTVTRDQSPNLELPLPQIEPRPAFNAVCVTLSVT